VQNGLISEFDLAGNAAADALAVAGACSAHSNDGERMEARTRIKTALPVQKMMLEILRAQGGVHRHQTEPRTMGDTTGTTSEEDSDKDNCEDACASSSSGGAD
jgi:hypothetical protein